MKILGLTGGIGSGKSTVARIFKTLGVPVYNSDQRAKELYFEPEIKKQVENLLGKEAYKNGKTLNKKYIRDKIFADTKILHALNAIIHPAVGKDFEDFKNANKKNAYLVKESALLFEAGIASQVDKILVISTNDALRKKRLAQRDQLSEKEIESILEKQMPEKDKIKKANWVIENNEEKLLIPQVIKIHQSLLN